MGSLKEATSFPGAASRHTHTPQPPAPATASSPRVMSPTAASLTAASAPQLRHSHPFPLLSRPLGYMRPIWVIQDTFPPQEPHLNHIHKVLFVYRIKATGSGVEDTDILQGMSFCLLQPFTSGIVTIWSTSHSTMLYNVRTKLETKNKNCYTPSPPQTVATAPTKQPSLSKTDIHCTHAHRAELSHPKAQAPFLPG